MKLVINFVLATSLVLHCYGQTANQNSSFVLKGNFNGRDSGVVVLNYSDSGNRPHEDTIRLHGGSFVFSGTTNHVSEAYLWADTSEKEFDNKSMIRFLLEPGVITITGRKGDEANSIIEGSASQAEKETWDEQKSALLTLKVQNIEAMDSVGRTYRKNRNPELKDKMSYLSDQRDSIYQQIRTADLRYVSAHPGSYLSAYLLSKHVRRMPVDSIQSYYTNLSNTVKESDVANDVLRYVYPMTDDNDFRKANPLNNPVFDKRLRNIGSVYALDLKDTLGNKVDLGTFRGKYLVIDFWSSTCEPCIKNIPALTQFMRSYDRDSIQFVSVSMDRHMSTWKRAVRKHHFEGLQVSDLGGFNGLAAVYCKVLWVPRYLVVDKEGKIINYDAPQPRDPAFSDMLDELLRSN